MMKDSGWFDSSGFFPSSAAKVTNGEKKRKLEDSRFGNSFKKPNSSTSTFPELKDELWSDKYTPQSAEGLAVHPKKVSAVRDWLTNVTQNFYHASKILLLSGPSGSGKTATLQTLAAEMGLQIVEWENPVEVSSYKDWNRNILSGGFDNPEDRVSFTSQKQNFKDWLMGSRYATLEETSESNSKLLVIEDFPSIAITNSSEFQDLILKYSKRRINPALVFICSEDNGSNSSLLRTVFKQDFLSSTGMEHIMFNPATTTNIVKLLTKVVSNLQKSKGSSLRIPDKSALESLSESTGGDIRAALNSLQFSCLTNSSSNDFSTLFVSSEKPQKSTKSKSRKSSKSNVSNLTTKSSQSTVGCKDKNLDIFHGLGKILYAKREQEFEEGYLPTHLESKRRQKLEANPEAVFEMTSMEEEPFCCYLHHSYPHFYSDISEASKLMEYISLGDTLLQDWGISGKINIKQYGVSMVSRAVMFNNQAQKASQGMRKFTKPDFYAANRNIQNNNLRLEGLGHNLQRLYPKKELSTVIIPSIGGMPRKPPGLKALQDLASFPISTRKVNTQLQASVCEDNFFDDDDELFAEFVDDLDFKESQSQERKDDFETEELDIQEYDSP